MFVFHLNNVANSFCIFVYLPLLIIALYNDKLTFQTNKFLSEIRDDFIVFGIMQDCQIFFVDRNSLDLIKNLKVDLKSRYCYPNQVKLHLQQISDQLSLLLLYKQFGNRVCTLPIEMPDLKTIRSEGIFVYSLYSSLPYAGCSHLKNQNFILEPDLSFMDSSLNDVIYFINAKSTGLQWDVQQFEITKGGHLQPLSKLSLHHSKFNNGAFNSEYAKDYMVEIDLNRSLLYSMNRFHKNLIAECSFDLLFRPEYVSVKVINFDNNIYARTWLDSFSVDENLLIFMESTRKVDRNDADIYMALLSDEKKVNHILRVEFVADLHVIKTKTVLELSKRKTNTLDDIKQNLKKNESNFYKWSTKNIPTTMSPTATSRNIYFKEATLPITSRKLATKIASTTKTLKTTKPPTVTKMRFTPKQTIISSTNSEPTVLPSVEVITATRPTTPPQTMLVDDIKDEEVVGSDIFSKHPRHNKIYHEKEKSALRTTSKDELATETSAEEPFWEDVDDSSGDEDDTPKLDKQEDAFPLPQHIYEYDEQSAAILQPTNSIKKPEAKNISASLLGHILPIIIPFTIYFLPFLRSPVVF